MSWQIPTPSVVRAELARAAFAALAYTIRRGVEVASHPSGPVLVSGGGHATPTSRTRETDATTHLGHRQAANNRELSPTP